MLVQTFITYLNSSSYRSSLSLSLFLKPTTAERVALEWIITDREASEKPRIITGKTELFVCKVLCYKGIISYESYINSPRLDKTVTR